MLLQAEDAALIAEGEEVTLMSWGNAIVRKAVAENGAARPSPPSPVAEPHFTAMRREQARSSG